MEQIPGGYSEEKKATAEIQQLVDSVGFVFNFDVPRML